MWENPIVEAPLSGSAGSVGRGNVIKCFVGRARPNTLTAMLGSEDRAILDFEQGWWLQPGPKDQAIEMGLGLTAALYYEKLRRLLGDPDAVAHDPLTVRRVLSMIESPRDDEVAV